MTRHVVMSESRGGTLWDVDALDLVSFCKAWRSLGDAVSEQVVDVLEGDDPDVNENAIELAVKELNGYNEEIDEALEEYLSKQVKESALTDRAIALFAEGAHEDAPPARWTELVHSSVWHAPIQELMLVAGVWMGLTSSEQAVLDTLTSSDLVDEDVIKLDDVLMLRDLLAPYNNDVERITSDLLEKLGETVEYVVSSGRVSSLVKSASARDIHRFLVAVSELDDVRRAVLDGLIDGSLFSQDVILDVDQSAVEEVGRSVGRHNVNVSVAASEWLAERERADKQEIGL